MALGYDSNEITSIPETRDYFLDELSDDQFSTVENSSYRLKIHKDFENTNNSNNEGVILDTYTHHRRGRYNLEIKTKFGEFIPKVTSDVCNDIIFENYNPDEILNIEQVDRANSQGCYFEIQDTAGNRKDLYFLYSKTELAVDPRYNSTTYYYVSIKYPEGGNEEVIKNLKTSLESFEIIDY